MRINVFSLPFLTLKSLYIHMQYAKIFSQYQNSFSFSFSLSFSRQPFSFFPSFPVLSASTNSKFQHFFCYLQTCLQFRGRKIFLIFYLLFLFLLIQLTIFSEQALPRGREKTPSKGRSWWLISLAINVYWNRGTLIGGKPALFHAV